MITKSHLVSGLAPGRELGRELGIWVPEARPAGAAVIRTYPMAGNFFHPPHPHAQAHHPIDFINPDCNLLGIKTLRTSANFDFFLKIGAKDCKIPQIQLHSCVDFQKFNAEKCVFSRYRSCPYSRKRAFQS